MSGGSMNYAYAKINNAADEVDRSAARGGNAPELRERLAAHLRMCSDVVKAIEWADSDDTAPDAWIESAEKLIGKLGVDS